MIFAMTALSGCVAAVLLVLADSAFDKMIDEVAHASPEPGLRAKLAPRSQLYELLRRHRETFPYSPTRRKATRLSVAGFICLAVAALLMRLIVARQ